MSAPRYPNVDPGQVVVLELDDRGERRSYPTRVHDVRGDLVWLETPAEYAVPAELAEPLGSSIRRLPTAFGLADVAAVDAVIHTWQLMDARYTLQARLVAARPYPRPILGLRIVEGTRLQDREYFRVPVTVKARASAVGPDGETWLFALDVLDLSAAGLRARSQIPLSTGAELDLTLRLRDLGESLSLRARVVRVIEPSRPPSLACVIGAAFVDLPPREREQIIRFALETQLEHRRRGRT
jgi:hypothetical protein